MDNSQQRLKKAPKSDWKWKSSLIKREPEPPLFGRKGPDKFKLYNEFWENLTKTDEERPNERRMAQRFELTVGTSESGQMVAWTAVFKLTKTQTFPSPAKTQLPTKKQTDAKENVSKPLGRGIVT